MKPEDIAETAWTRYRWRKVNTVHDQATECAGEVRHHTYRFYMPDSPRYERCVGLGWCSRCRRWQATMVHVPRAVDLPDPLAGLDPDQRDRLRRSEYALVRHLDRVDRRNAKP
ncbi:hypothetical protein [Kutzneria sp. CA-103260]|uniref:hypothetical protein n=1 Tax=Kutzneria sp. CA-103260 TaxID=2802641 RepID=UPI001BA58093|nr:hypothetical protein [Kutzneria sp. CA-103260]QUQ71355.1 hypothetical protein JJ691_91400 [Kutzneria sp. CA-103260]